MHAQVYLLKGPPAAGDQPRIRQLIYLVEAGVQLIPHMLLASPLYACCIQCITHSLQRTVAGCWYM